MTPYESLHDTVRAGATALGAEEVASGKLAPYTAADQLIEA